MVFWLRGHHAVLGNKECYEQRVAHVSIGRPYHNIRVQGGGWPILVFSQPATNLGAPSFPRLVRKGRAPPKPAAQPIRFVRSTNSPQHKSPPGQQERTINRKNRSVIIANTPHYCSTDASFTKKLSINLKFLRRLRQQSGSAAARYPDLQCPPPPHDSTHHPIQLLASTS